MPVNGQRVEACFSITPATRKSSQSQLYRSTVKAISAKIAQVRVPQLQKPANALTRGATSGLIFDNMFVLFEHIHLVLQYMHTEGVLPAHGRSYRRIWGELNPSLRNGSLAWFSLCVIARQLRNLGQTPGDALLARSGKCRQDHLWICPCMPVLRIRRAAQKKSDRHLCHLVNTVITVPRKCKPTAAWILVTTTNPAPGA